jgi:excisionase family DNA binding protein
MKDRVTIQEAARRLGVKDDAIRKRIQRGSLEHDKDPDGRVYVYLDATHDTSQDTWQESTWYATQDEAQDTTQDTSGDTSYAALAEALQEQVQYLRSVIETRDKELEARTEELLRRDHIIARLTERIPAIEASPEPRDPPETSSEASGNGGTPPDVQEYQQRRSWLYRFFFGP